MDFKELKILNLDHNIISDISILEKVNFKELKELYLRYNKINKSLYNSTISILKSELNLFI